MILILILTVAVLVLICIFGFRTRKIQVSGNVYYGEGTITNWIEKDPLSVNSLYLLGKYTFDKGELPSGVESLKVSLKNPWTVAVTVVEKSMLGYVDYDEAMLYFDEQGIATLRSAKQIEGVPYIEGLSFDTAEVEIGKVLPVEDDAIFEKLAETSRYLRKNALSPERIVCNTDGSDVVLYFGAVEVLLGNEKYEERLAQVGPILEELKNETRTIILYEAPHRLVRTLEELKEALGNRKMTLCRELTKKHETAFHTTIEDLITFYQTEKPLGECVLVIQGRSRQEMEEEQKASWEKVTIEEHMEIYENQGHSRKEAMKLVANDRGVTKRDIYQYLINK